MMGAIDARQLLQRPGTTRKQAMRIKCRLNTPKFSLSSAGSRRARPNNLGLAPTSLCMTAPASGWHQQRDNSDAPPASRAVTQNTEASPPGGNNGPEHQGDRKRQADTHADNGHGLGALLGAGQVRHQGHDRGGDGAGALDRPPR